MNTFRSAMIPCRFFSRGSCRNGDACPFLHERAIKTGSHLRPHAPVIPDIGTLNINSYPKPLGFASGPEVHGRGTARLSSDTRGQVLCRFVARSGGCRNTACPYSHEITGGIEHGANILETDQREDEADNHIENHPRNFAGATVHFDEVGDVEKISFPSDFSVARVSGLPSRSTPETVVNALRELKFAIDPQCVRIPKQDSSRDTMAIVKVDDPSFAQRLGEKVKHQKSRLLVATMPVDSRRTNARKIYLSWHKSTRSVWLNFGNDDIANRVAKRFNNGTYKVMGQMIKSSAVKHSGPAHIFSYNPVAWTITLSNVPNSAKAADVEAAIRFPHDNPRHVEMGERGYDASDAEVSVDVRSRLEEHGPIEKFFLSPNQHGKRAKATAWFQDEIDARSACSMNDTKLSILEGGKITVTLIQTAKVKVSAAIYNASKTRIDQENRIWIEQHLTLHTYHDIQHQFVTLKVEGEDAKNVAGARRRMDETFRGERLVDNGKALWNHVLANNGAAYKKLKLLEKEMDIVISRDKSRRQLHYHGPPDKFLVATHRIIALFKQEPGKVHTIYLNSSQVSWTIRGGFKKIQQTLGENVATFDIVSKQIAIHGTNEQHEAALDIMAGKRTTVSLALSDSTSEARKDCPICFCEAEHPVATSCGHTYCLECFEESCKAAASSSSTTFQVQCPGDEGACRHIFSLEELRDCLSSSIFETMLQSSFEEHIKRHPSLFHYCPTPGCAYIYRCTTSSGETRPTYTCANCLELLCTSCHALHGTHTCAEYKDIQSGGYKALAKLKKELNIKDCPRCSTSMEKTEGCNHMTCSGCRAHICWSCMAVFDGSEACYAHMNRVHGGIGLELERFG